DEIRKPAFRLDVETDRHVYVVGQRIRVSTTASFYDGTPVPGVPLRISAVDEHATATSNALGIAVGRLPARLDYDPEGWAEASIEVAPARPEEGDMLGTAPVALLPSRVWLTGDGSLTDSRIVVRGTLTWADIHGMEAKLDAGGYLVWDADGPGRPIGSGSITVRVLHEVLVRRQTGTTYDFIEKRVVPQYDYETREVALATRTLT